MRPSEVVMAQDFAQRKALSDAADERLTSEIVRVARVNPDMSLTQLSTRFGVHRCRIKRAFRDAGVAR